jgi:hypothetical protein
LKHPVRPSLQEYKELAAKTPEITINFSLSPGESQPYPADNINAVRPDVVQIRAYLACELVGWLAPINLIMTRLLPRLDSAGLVGTSDLSYRILIFSFGVFSHCEIERLVQRYAIYQVPNVLIQHGTSR